MILELSRSIFTWAIILPSIFFLGSRFQPIVITKDTTLRGVLYCALGMACLSFSVILFSAFHLLNPTAIWSFLIILVLLQYRSFKSLTGWLRSVISDLTSAKTISGKFLNWCFALSCVALLIGTLTPETGGDALTYQLNLPKGFLLKGSIQPDYYDLNSYLSLFMNYLYLIGLATGGVYTAKLFHFFCGFLLFVAVKRTIAEEIKHDGIATFFGLVVWLTPTIYNLLSTAYVDGAVTFYVFLALYVLIKAFDQASWKSFLLSGFLLGCAVAIKYTAMFSFLGLFGLWLFELIKRRQPLESCKYFFIWFISFSIACGYWFVRNLIMTGNPVFPYAASVFHTAPLAGTQYQTYGIGKSFFDFLSIFWTMFYSPTAFGSFGSRIGIFYFLFLPFLLVGAFFVPRSRKFLVFILFFMISWFYVCQAHRYVLPVLPAVSVAGALGFYKCCSMASPKMEKILKTLVGSVGLIILVVYLLEGMFHYRYAYLLFSGRWNTDTYLLKMERTWPISKWVNKELPVQSKLLVVEEPRQFYFDRPIMREVYLKYRTHYDQASNNVESTSKLLKSLGISHILTTADVLRQDTMGTKEPIGSLLQSHFATMVYSVQSQNIRDEKYVYEVYHLN